MGSATTPIDQQNPEYLHTPNYCEENVYHLIQRLQSEHAGSGQAAADRTARLQPTQRLYAVFVSNPQRRCLLFNQKAAGDKHFLIWDYHVFVVLVGTDGHAEVWDLDSTLPLPIPFADYVKSTFQPQLYLDTNLLSQLNDLEPPRFRVVSAPDFLQYFASDRSHMLIQSPQGELVYSSAAPVWPPIQSAGARQRSMRHNLWTRYLEMALPGDQSSSETLYLLDWDVDESIYGTVMDFAAFIAGHWTAKL